MKQDVENDKTLNELDAKYRLQHGAKYLGITRYTPGKTHIDVVE